MEYDLPRIWERIQYIETALARLETLRSLPEEIFLEDFRNVQAAKHLLQTAIEAMMDIAGHIVARRRLGVPREGAEVFRRLGGRLFACRAGADLRPNGSVSESGRPLISRSGPPSCLRNFANRAG